MPRAGQKPHLDSTKVPFPLINPYIFAVVGKKSGQPEGKPVADIMFTILNNSRTVVCVPKKSTQTLYFYGYCETFLPHFEVK